MDVKVFGPESFMTPAGLSTSEKGNDPIREAAECNACGQAFTSQQWDDRHTDGYGEDVHEECCEICKPEPTP